MQDKHLITYNRDVYLHDGQRVVSHIVEVLFEH